MPNPVRGLPALQELGVRISVPKIAEIGAFEHKIRMSAILEIRGLFLTENSRNQKKGIPFIPH